MLLVQTHLHLTDGNLLKPQTQVALLALGLIIICSVTLVRYYANCLKLFLVRQIFSQQYFLLVLSAFLVTR